MVQKNKGRVVLVLGGVRSGKSRFAQELAERAGSVTFVATAERRDDEEMRAKIARHVADRPAEWITVEEPLELGTQVLGAASELVLIDCLTLFAANVLEADGGAAQVDALCAALAEAPCAVVLVSNEVGSGVVPAYALGRQFRDLVGEINQQVAAVADVVVMLVAGLPVFLKGSAADLVVPASEPQFSFAKNEAAIMGFLVAGTASGVGKTTVTLAILAAMRARGLAVQALKGGPDFLDTGHHTRVSGRVARNLDTWMLSAESNRAVLAEGAARADAVIVEGMMGLFDGKEAATDLGSSAEIAKLLGLPVVLVVDAGKSARSVAAVVLGFELFDPGLRLAGVVLNRVASERHYAMLAEAIGARCRTPVLGWIGREPAIAIPERHLGLQTVEETGTETLREALVVAGARLDLEALLRIKIAGAEAPLRFSTLSEGLKPSASTGKALPEPTVRVGVARDAAFSFYYEDNLDLLRQAGAEVVSFSPIHDAALPDGLDALYLGGGYPELYAGQLSGNATMLRSVRAFAAEGKPVYAECGGMLYLAQSLATKDGREHAMCGVLPFRFAMTAKLVNFGYVTVMLTRDCLLGSAGTELRGHSFHYSQRLDAEAAETCYEVTYSLSKRVEQEGFRDGNVLASYVHLHFRTAPGIAEAFVAAALAARLQEVLA